MKFDVVCFGSATVDVFLKSKGFKTVHSKRVKTGVAMCQVMGGKVKVDELVITSGGGATNAGVSFERKGIQTASAVCVGADFWGQFIRQELNSEGVSLVHLQEDKIYPTSYSTILVNEQGRRTALVYRGASNQLDLKRVRWEALNTDWFYISSLGGDLALLTKVLRIAQDNGFKVAFNPGSKEIKNRDKLTPFLKSIEVLILNCTEASQLTGIKETRQQDMVEKLQKMGPKIVALTDGDKGSIIGFGKKVYQAEIFKVKTQEETGAGDAFGSGLVAGLILNLKPKEVIKLASANSASVVTKMGAKEGLLWKEEVLDWLKKPLKIK